MSNEHNPMTMREKMLAVFRGQMVDVLPWVPRIELWYKAARRNGTLPAKYRDWELWDILKDMGVGLFAVIPQIAPWPKMAAKGGEYKSILGLFSGPGLAVDFEAKGVEIIQRSEGCETITEYITPVGSVTTSAVLTPEMEKAGISALVTERAIKDAHDYTVVEHIFRNVEVIPTYERFLEFQREIGDSGVVGGCMPASCPMHLLWANTMSFEQAIYELHDNPIQVQRLLDALDVIWKKLETALADSPAEIVVGAGNLDRSLTPPPLFRKYWLPYIQELSQLLHSKGKLVQAHADGENSGILELIAEAGIDIAEAFAPPPMTQCSIREARSVWGDRITIWGGIGSVVFTEEAMDDEEFEAHMEHLFREIAPGDHFILGTADNVPTNGKFERLERVTELVRQRGKLPIWV